MIVYLMFFGLAAFNVGKVAYAQSPFPNKTYTSISSKFVNDNVPARASLHFIQRDVCQWFISKSAYCPHQVPKGLEVRVSDATPYPSIQISDMLDSVSVVRQHDESGGCERIAYVNLKVHCEGMPIMEQDY